MVSEPLAALTTPAVAPAAIERAMASETPQPARKTLRTSEIHVRIRCSSVRARTLSHRPHGRPARALERGIGRRALRTRYGGQAGKARFEQPGPPLNGHSYGCDKTSAQPPRATSVCA